MPGSGSRAFDLFDAALDCVVVMDAAGLVIELNASAEATFGHRRADVIGRPLADVLIPERFRDAHRAGLARYLASGRGTVLGKRLELHALRADGTELPVELAISATRGAAGEQVFIGFLRDLTARAALDEQRERVRAELEAAAARMARLQASTAALGSARSVADVADAVLGAGLSALGATTAVFVRRASETTLRIVASAGVPEEVRASFDRFAAGANTPAADVFRTAEAQWVEDVETFRARYGAIADALGVATASAAALPLLIGGEVAAAVAFRFTLPRRFDPADRALLETFAAQAAQALERVLAYEQELEGRRKLEALGDLTARLATTMTEAQIATAVLERGMTAMAADTCMLFRLEPDGALALVAERGCSPTVAASLQRIPAGSGNASAEAVRTGRSLWVESAAEYRALFPAVAGMQVEGRRAEAFWAVPLVVEGHPMGLLAMGSYEPRRFSPADRLFVETFARNAAQALVRAQRLEGETRARRALETTLRSIGDAVMATDTKGAITFVNPIAERLTGWTQQEALGRPVHEVFRIVNETTRAPVVSPVDRVLAEGVVVGLANHTLLVTKDGRDVPIDDSGAPIRDADGTLLGVVLVFRDVTEKKRDEGRRTFLANAAAALSSSLDYAQTLARTAELVVPMFADWCSVDVVGADGIAKQVAVAHVDPVKIQMAKDLGARYPADPNAPTGVPNVLRTGRAELYPEIPEALLLAAAVDDEHMRLIRALELRSAMVVPLAARGHVLGAITFVSAESRRSFTPDDLAFAEELARRAAIAVDNARLYAAEQEARKAADLATHVKDDFLATISHELRTPLNAIMGWAKMLGGGTLDAARAARAVATIDRNAVAMAQLVDDLLDVSRIVSGKLRLELQAVDLARVIEAAVDSARPAAAARGITIASTITRAPAELRADPARIAQVAGNLLSNAVKFSNQGGRVEVSLRHDGSSFELRVADQGRGIDPAFLPHVFEPFRQADGKITRAHGGLGLGLAITRQLVELHHGTVQAASDGEGKGATFVVTLPDGAASPSVDGGRAGTAGDGRRRELEGLRVLAVDDDEDARMLVRAILEEYGCVVETADSAAAAMSALSGASADVLVSDIGMPGEDGTVLIRRIRALPVPLRDLPAVALTAFSRADDRRRVLDAGFTMHMAKPVEPARLVAAIAELARGRSAPVPG